MNIHEFGKENEKTILLIHPSVVKWDYFEYVIPLLQKNYQEQIALELNSWLKTEGYIELYAVYGCSMGGSIALMVILGQIIKIEHCIMDGCSETLQQENIMENF